MPAAQNFTDIATTSHSRVVSGLVNGGSYNYYVKCKDFFENANYLDTVINMTAHGNGIQKTTFLDSNNVDSFSGNFNYCVSCYALGEFDTPVKHRYIHSVVSKIEHGLILWNPHLNKDEQGELLLQQYHPNIVITPEEPLTGLHNLEMRF